MKKKIYKKGKYRSFLKGLSFLTFYGAALLFGHVTSYDFKQGSCLSFSLELKSKYQYRLEKNDNPPVNLISNYLLKFFIMDKNSKGEALIAATSHFEKASVVPIAGTKLSEREKRFEKWLQSMERDEFSSFVLDRWGNMIKGSMVWPEATCFHMPKILSRLSISRQFGENSRFLIQNSFQGTIGKDGRDLSVYKNINPNLKLRLFIDNNDSLPYVLEAEYAYVSLAGIYKQNLHMRSISIKHSVKAEDFLQEENMLAAILQASLLAEKWDVSFKVIQRALFSKKKEIQIIATRYIAEVGIPEGIDMREADKNPDETVQFNLAKVKYRYQHDKKGMELLSKRSSKDLKTRINKFLRNQQPAVETKEDLIQALNKCNSVLNQDQEKDFYQRARNAMLSNKKILHFGPNTYALISGTKNNHVFRYNVWIPYDYDPQERYPLIIGMAGGNGFSEGHFMSRAAIIPNNYILVSPDADYGKWWEPDQVKMFDDLLKDLSQKFSIDQDRKYMHGFSNGAIASYLYGYLHPDAFAAISPMMGYSRSDVSNDDLETEMCLNMLNTPLLIIHGTKDRTISVISDRILSRFLRRNRIPHKYHEMKAKGHDITFLTNHKEVLGFFRKHERNPAPKKIYLIVNDPKYNRNFWIQLDQKKDLSRRARVKAERKENRFEISVENVKKISLVLNDFHYDRETEYHVILNKKEVFRGYIKLNPVVLIRSLSHEYDYAKLYGVKLTFDPDN